MLVSAMFGEDPSSYGKEEEEEEEEAHSFFSL